MSGLAFSLGGLTKEVALIFAVAVAAYLLVNSRNWRGALKVLGVSLAVYATWAVIVSAWLGDTIFQARMSRIEVIPFGGLWFVNYMPGLTIDILWIAGPALIAGVMVLIDWWKSKKISLEMLLVSGQRGPDCLHAALYLARLDRHAASGDRPGDRLPALLCAAWRARGLSFVCVVVLVDFFTYCVCGQPGSNSIIIS